MKHQKKLRERYIQLVETFITAIESGRSGVELEDIRTEIRTISAQLGVNNSVENSTQIYDIRPLKDQGNEAPRA